MKQSLLEHFSSTRSGKDAFARLTCLEQRGSARDYTRRFRELSLQADKTLITPNAQKFYYIKGLRLELRTHVETLDPASYDDAVRIAEAADEAHSYSNSSRRAEQRSAQHRKDRQADNQRAHDRRDRAARPERPANGPVGPTRVQAAWRSTPRSSCSSQWCSAYGD